MPLNTADQNPNTFNVLPASTQKIGTDRGWCSWFERPMTSNVFGDRIQIVDLNMQTFVWNGVEWNNPALTTDSVGNKTPFTLDGGDTLGIVRTLKNFTGQNTLTGGTINTKTLLMQVPLPDGCLLDYRAGIRVSAIFGFTLNTNSKACGVDIGTSFGTATNLWGRTRASATSGAESLLIDFQRSPLDPVKLLLAYGQAAPYEGAPNNNISTYTLHHSIDPASTGLSLYFWGNLITANTDQVTLARAKVELATAEN